jgi:hypothetical protein
MTNEGNETPNTKVLDPLGENDQENLVRHLANSSLAYANAFMPEKVEKNQDEPSDVAVFVNGICFLFYCKDSKNKSREKLDQKNLGQGKKWVRLWDDTRRIKGRNKVQSFDISKDDVSHIFIISVLPSRFEECAHLELKPLYDNLNVVSATSLPIDLISYVFSVGGNITDLINTINMISQNKTINKFEIQNFYNYVQEEAIKEINGDFITNFSMHNESLLGMIAAIRQRELSIVPGDGIHTLGIFEISWIAAFFYYCEITETNTGKFVFSKKSRYFGDFTITCIYGSTTSVVIENISNASELEKEDVIVIIWFGPTEIAGPLVAFDQSYILKSIKSSIRDLQHSN